MSQQYPQGQWPPGQYPQGQYPGYWPPGHPHGQWPAMPAVPPVKRKPPLPSYPHPEPREYHHMLLTWNYSWWRPVVGIVLVAVGMVVVAPFVLLPVLALGVSFEGGSFWANFERAASFEAIGPAALLYLNLTLGSTILVCWFVMRVLHRMRPRWLTSVAPKMRWSFFFACLGLAAAALVAQVVVGLVLPGSEDTEISGQVNDFTTTTAALAVIVLLTTPLQAAGEEYVFRGYLMQAFGALFRYKWVALVTTATLFALAHGAQNFPLFFDRFMFGLIAGWLVLRTGGLEAGIALHILNNFLAFGFALAFSDITETLSVSEADWWNIPLTLTQSLVYAGLVLLVAQKMRLQRRTNPPALPPSGPSAHDPRPVPSQA